MIFHSIPCWPAIFFGASCGCEFQHLIGRTQPVPCRYFAAFNSLQKLIQKRPHTWHEDFQVRHLLPGFLRNGRSQRQFACQQRVS